MIGIARISPAAKMATARINGRWLSHHITKTGHERSPVWKLGRTWKLEKPPSVTMERSPCRRAFWDGSSIRRITVGSRFGVFGKQGHHNAVAVVGRAEADQALEALARDQQLIGVSARGGVLGVGHHEHRRIGEPTLNRSSSFSRRKGALANSSANRAAIAGRPSSSTSRPFSAWPSIVRAIATRVTARR
jgi:hypothetical protein